jgi:hypothetical protein
MIATLQTQAPLMVVEMTLVAAEVIGSTILTESGRFDCHFFASSKLLNINLKTSSGIP